MIQHAMKYVQLSERVRETLDPEHWLSAELREIEVALASAESSVVRAYVRWRNTMSVVAQQGNARAKRYVEETTWDLT